MSQVWIRAKIEDAYIEAHIEGLVDEDDWRRACDECGVPVHVTRVLALRVKAVGGSWFPAVTWHAAREGRLSKQEAEAELRRRWLEDDHVWQPRVLGSEMTAVRAPGPQPGAVPLFEEGDQ